MRLLLCDKNSPLFLFTSVLVGSCWILWSLQTLSVELQKLKSWDWQSAFFCCVTTWPVVQNLRLWCCIIWHFHLTLAPPHCLFFRWTWVSQFPMVLATVCKTARPMLSVRCLSVCLSVCPVCLSVTFMHCGQTVGQIKTKLGMQVGLSPDHIVLNGDPAPSPTKGHSRPNFRPTSVAAKWLHGSRCHLVWS